MAFKSIVSRCCLRRLVGTCDFQLGGEWEELAFWESPQKLRKRDNQHRTEIKAGSPVCFLAENCSYSVLCCFLTRLLQR